MYGISIGNRQVEGKGTTRVARNMRRERQVKNCNLASTRARQPDARWDINKILIWDIQRIGRHYQRHRPRADQSAASTGQIWNGSIRNLADIYAWDARMRPAGDHEQALTQDKDKKIGQASRDRPGPRHPRRALSPSMGRWSGAPNGPAWR